MSKTGVAHSHFKRKTWQKDIEIEKRQLRLQTGTGAVKRPERTLKNLIVANLEDRTVLTESVS